MTSSAGARPRRGWALGFALAVLAVGLAVDQAVAGAHVAGGLGRAACLVAPARACGLTAADLGLAWSTWRAGLRWGAVAAAFVAALYAPGSLSGPVRAAAPRSGGPPVPTRFERPPRKRGAPRGTRR